MWKSCMVVLLVVQSRGQVLYGFYSCVLPFFGTKWFIGRAELKRITQSTYITFKRVCAMYGVPVNCGVSTDS